MNIDRRTEPALKPGRPTLTESLMRVYREATRTGWCALAAAVAASAWAVSSVRPALALAVYSVSLTALIAAAAIDVVEQRLPNVLMLGTATLGLVALSAISILTGAGSPWRAVTGGAILGGWILLGALLVRDGYGLGDVKLAAACGILTGWLSWAALAVAVLATQASIFALLISARMLNRASASLGPAFVAGLLAALVVQVWWSPTHATS